MDLKAELLGVLNNPTTFWEAIVTNLSPSSRTALLVFTSCGTPVSLVAWQEAIAKIDIRAAAEFESAIRSLDDSFLRIQRDRRSVDIVDYRNPSMDDFCANKLDQSAGFVTTIVTHEPTYQQLARLAELALASDPSNRARYRYPHLYETLIAGDTLILDPLLSLHESAVDGSSGTLEHVNLDLLALVLTVFAAADQSTPRTEDVSSRLVRSLRHLNFKSSPRIPFNFLDRQRQAAGLHKALLPEFEEFYESLWRSARSPSEFDSVMNLDETLSRSPESAAWADEFFDRADTWATESGDFDDVSSNKGYYEKVAEYLALDTSHLESVWEETLAEAGRDGDPEPDEDDPDWRSHSEYSEAVTLSSLVRESGEVAAINSLFHTLNEAADRE